MSVLSDRKKQAQEVFERSKRLIPGARILGADTDFLADLIRFHPDAERKIGCGIASFSIGQDDRGGSCFVLRRLDGSQTDFSFYKCCLGPKAQTNLERERTLKALRNAVEDQVVAFRREAFAAGRIFCPVKGWEVFPNTSHVDHHPRSFVDLVNDWLVHDNLAFDAVCVSPRADNSTTCVMTDAWQRASWRRFHQANAVLRVTSVIGNLGKKRKKAA